MRLAPALVLGAFFALGLPTGEAHGALVGVGRAAVTYDDPGTCDAALGAVLLVADLQKGAARLAFAGNRLCHVPFLVAPATMVAEFPEGTCAALGEGIDCAQGEARLTFTAAGDVWYRFGSGVLTARVSSVHL